MLMKRNTGIILLVISFIAYPLLIYIIISSNGYNFNREGKSIRCCADNLQGGYEYVECDLKVHPKYGTKVCDCTTEMILAIDGKTYLWNKDANKEMNFDEYEYNRVDVLR